MDDTLNRPTQACATCPPPKKVGHWRLAPPGYRTCTECYDNLRDDLKDIAARYLLLDASPGANTEAGTRGAPGFGSRPAASPHIIVMTDWRSKSCEIAVDGIQYIWDPLADDTLEDGQYGPPAGAYVGKREVWYGRDGRGHAEQEKPPLSVPGTLASLAALIAEERDQPTPTARTVHELTRWLDAQMDWVTRHAMVTDFRDLIRALVSQLKPATGEPGRKHIGTCPNTIDEGETTRACQAKLYAPTRGDTIKCTACLREWHRPDWENLGNLLQAETMQQAS